MSEESTDRVHHTARVLAMWMLLSVIMALPMGTAALFLNAMPVEPGFELWEVVLGSLVFGLIGLFSLSEGKTVDERLEESCHGTNWERGRTITNFEPTNDDEE